ncbi:MAG: hypothetical protein ACPH9U_08050, partial [Candidatus Puniceispirillaceae bacterium]
SQIKIRPRLKQQRKNRREKPEKKHQQKPQKKHQQKPQKKHQQKLLILIMLIPTPTMKHLPARQNQESRSVQPHKMLSKLAVMSQNLGVADGGQEARQSLPF